MAEVFLEQSRDSVDAWDTLRWAAPLLRATYHFTPQRPITPAQARSVQPREEDQVPI